MISLCRVREEGDQKVHPLRCFREGIDIRWGQRCEAASIRKVGNGIDEEGIIADGQTQNQTTGGFEIRHHRRFDKVITIFLKHHTNLRNLSQ